MGQLRYSVVAGKLTAAMPLAKRALLTGAGAK